MKRRASTQLTPKSQDPSYEEPLFPCAEKPNTPRPSYKPIKPLNWNLDDNKTPPWKKPLPQKTPPPSSENFSEMLSFLQSKSVQNQTEEFLHNSNKPETNTPRKILPVPTPQRSLYTQVFNSEAKLVAPRKISQSNLLLMSSKDFRVNVLVLRDCIGKIRFSGAINKSTKTSELQEGCKKHHETNVHLEVKVFDLNQSKPEEAVFCLKKENSTKLIQKISEISQTVKPPVNS